MWAFYFLEKPAANPHWHGLVRLTPPPGMLAKHEELFDRHAESIWKALVPSGTVKSLPIFDQRGGRIEPLNECYAEGVQKPILEPCHFDPCRIVGPYSEASDNFAIPSCR